VKNIGSLRFGAWGVMLGAVAVACQPAAPSSELVTARRVYDQARQGATAELDPTGVEDAHTSLQAAEAVHHEAPGSNRERNQAYIAIRKSELAMMRAREASAREEQERIARAQGAEMNQALLQQAEAELEQRERELRAVLEAVAMAGAESGAMMAQEEGPVRITGVFFETGRDELTPVARKQLDIVATELQASPDASTVIEGFTDTRGDERQNLELSERRANAVREYLSSRGVEAERLEAVGLGESHPVASNTTPTGRETNRRVEIATGADPSQRQPVSGKDSDFPDDPKTREPDAEEPR
jgi:outer membrane protein OmpA-like peptidoglycan-associated protein